MLSKSPPPPLVRVKISPLPIVQFGTSGYLSSRSIASVPRFCHFCAEGVLHEQLVLVLAGCPQCGRSKESLPGRHVVRHFCRWRHHSFFSSRSHRHENREPPDRRLSALRRRSLRRDRLWTLSLFALRWRHRFCPLPSRTYLHYREERTSRGRPLHRHFHTPRILPRHPPRLPPPQVPNKRRRPSNFSALLLNRHLATAGASSLP